MYCTLKVFPESSSVARIVTSNPSNYDFRYSLIDIPLISIIRSAIILCVYGLCDGPKLSRGPYLTITMFCSISSLIYVSCKAAFVFGEPVIGGGSFRTEEVALFVCSSVLAIGHIVVAYRTSCREKATSLQDRHRIRMDKLISSMKFAFLLLLLMMISVNISTGNEEDRMLMTGLHTVTDIFCVGCGSNVGWKYVTAHDINQKYKEGKSVLELYKIVGPYDSNDLVCQEISRLEI
ncbi:hypothetical protein Bca52824_077378 [Brassica carinata]|uniref:Yippee domain-containing protein n=1 Tax=Brassica carinata TaxID=52824 RepID=A0A8X7PYU7_BRACI|nr:hypothetical protein Bca52824_077378 [Brassica carinata]